jgi:hypothetical protein
LYAADNGAGLYKYSLSGGNWIFNGNIAGVYFGITGKVSGSSVTLFAARKASGKNESELVKLVDNSGYNGSFTGTPTKLTTSPMYTVFRGLSLSPAVPGAPGARRSESLPAENTTVPTLVKEAVSGTTEMKIVAANGLLTVIVNSPVAQRATLAIYDISGRKQLQTTLQLAKGNNRFQLDNPVQKGPAVAQLLSGTEKTAIKFLNQ